MKSEWTSKAILDLARLHDFLAAANPLAAQKVVGLIVSAPDKLLQHPRLGERLEAFDPRHVRRLLIGDYEMRYEIRNETIFILRIWHTRERR